MKRFLAQAGYPLGNLEPPAGMTEWIPGNEPLQQVEKVISVIVGFLTVVAGIYFIILFILAAYNWMSAGGDKNKLDQAKNKMSYAVVGLVVVVAAYALIGLIGYVMGFSILQPASLLGEIWPT